MESATVYIKRHGTSTIFIREQGQSNGKAEVVQSSSEPSESKTPQPTSYSNSVALEEPVQATGGSVAWQESSTLHEAQGIGSSSDDSGPRYRLTRINSDQLQDKSSEEYRRKRERNNLSVRKSREKSRMRMKETNRLLKELQLQKKLLEGKVETLTKEVDLMRDLLMGQLQPSNNVVPGSGDLVDSNLSTIETVVCSDHLTSEGTGQCASDQNFVETVGLKPKTENIVLCKDEVVPCEETTHSCTVNIELQSLSEDAVSREANVVVT